MPLKTLLHWQIATALISNLTIKQLFKIII